MTEFTPLISSVGGAMIGLASLMLLFGIGRIAGISGIVGGALTGDERPWKLAFVGGLISAALIWLLVASSPAAGTISSSLPVVIVGGVLVGFGTRLGSGCTSGHGVCGIGRFSARSIVATCTFMAVAGVTVFVTRHVMGGAL